MSRDKKMDMGRRAILIIIINFVLIICIIAVNIAIREVKVATIHQQETSSVVRITSKYENYFEEVTAVSFITIIISMGGSLLFLIFENKQINSRLNALVGSFEEVGLSSIPVDNPILSDYEKQVISAWNNSIYEVEYLNNLREKYFKNMIHDLKTPIQLLIMNLQMIKLKPGNQNYINALEEEISNLDKNIANYLLIEKITFFERVDYKELELSEYFKHVIERYECLGMTTLLSIEPGANTIIADSVMLNRIIENIIDNAIKYGSEKLIEISVTDECLIFTNKVISDSDIGDIFTAERNYSLKGNGLGTEIISTYVKLLGWQVWSEHNNGLFKVVVKHR